MLLITTMAVPDITALICIVTSRLAEQTESARQHASISLARYSMSNSVEDYKEYVASALKYTGSSALFQLKIQQARLVVEAIEQNSSVLESLNYFLNEPSVSP